MIKKEKVGSLLIYLIFKLQRLNNLLKINLRIREGLIFFKPFFCGILTKNSFL